MTITLWRADAIVLFDWLRRFDMNSVPIDHPAQKQPFTDLLNRMEQDTDVIGCSNDQIAAAQAEVGKDMGW